MLLRMVVAVRYLHLKSLELHEALMSAHEIIGDAVEEKVYLQRQAPPAADASAQPVVLLTNQVVTMSSKHQEALAELSACFQQQLDSPRANDERIIESLRQRQ